MLISDIPPHLRVDLVREIERLGYNAVVTSKQLRVYEREPAIDWIFTAWQAVKEFMSV